MIAVFSLLPSASTLAKEPTPAPKFEVIAAAVEGYFATMEDYQPGDLISRAQIRGAVGVAGDTGWPVPDLDAVVELGLANDSPLINQFSTPGGRKFIRKVAKVPGGLPRLDRLSAMPRGRKILNDLARAKGGDELIKYLATTRGGHKLGKQLAAVPDGGDLNKPTGLIYTEADLIAELKQRFEKTP